ncbi:MAG TPA: hypothetical protein VGM39_13900 [Kofleriaceae bacterium]|jgi:hypothetical protein
MATKRRGFAPPDLRGTLGTLVRSALQQVTGVRETLERGAREGRSRLDDYRSGQRRRDMLAELGEVVLDLVRRGEIDAEQLPEARAVIHELDHLDDADSHGHSHSHEDEHEHDHAHAPRDYAMPPTRSRFDTRSTGRDERRGPDDGTVSSGARWAPPARTGRPTNVWRPPADYAPHSNEAPDDADAPPARHAKPAPRKGGITFGNDSDDDSDLAEYMHPDDVPPKSDDNE